jgi:hypothetical protein
LPYAFGDNCIGKFVSIAGVEVADGLYAEKIGEPFTFKPLGMQSDDTAGGAICIRPPLPVTASESAYHGSQEAGAVSSYTSGLPDAINTFSQPPVEHPPYPLELVVMFDRMESRVESVIKMELLVRDLPFGVTKVRLPKHTIRKPKSRAKQPPKPSPDTLQMHAVLVCTTAMEVPNQKSAALQRAKKAAGLRKEPGSAEEKGQREEVETRAGGEVLICDKCIRRERKLLGRMNSEHYQDEEACRQDEASRVIVFNTEEVEEWEIYNVPNAGSHRHWRLQAPMRITCTCQHHAEQQGFQIIITLTDHNGNILAQTLSPSIMRNTSRTSIAQLRARPGDSKRWPIYVPLAPLQPLPPRLPTAINPGAAVAPSSGFAMPQASPFSNTTVIETALVSRQSLPNALPAPSPPAYPYPVQQLTRMHEDDANRSQDPATFYSHDR